MGSCGFSRKLQGSPDPHPALRMKAGCSERKGCGAQESATADHNHRMTSVIGRRCTRYPVSWDLQFPDCPCLSSRMKRSQTPNVWLILVVRWRHFDSPGCGGTNVHAGAKISCDIPCLRRTEPVTFAFVDYVVEAPCRFISLILETFAHEKSRVAQGRANPDFSSLFIRVKNGAICAHTISCTHFTVAEFHDVEREDLLHRGELHGMGHDVAKTSEVCVPLAGNLVRLDGVLGFAVRVVAEIFAVPELRDVGLLSLEEEPVVFVGGRYVADYVRGFFRGAQSGEPKATGIGADPPNYP